MPTIQLSCGAVHYLEQGRGLPLVLLHANPGDSRDFEAVIPALARHYRVLALDWPGYGQSSIPKNPETLGALFFHAVLKELLQALSLPPALFIGNSLGGNAAARLAIESPERVRGLVLAAGGGFTPHNFVTRAFCAFQGSRWAMSPKLWASLYLGQRTGTVTAMLQRAATLQSAPPRLALNRAVWRSFAEPQHDLRGRASAIKAPALLLYGKNDPALPAGKDGKVAARCIPHARFVTLPCRHASFAEIPEEFLAQVLPFLAQCAPAEALRLAAA